MSSWAPLRQPLDSLQLWYAKVCWKTSRAGPKILKTWVLIKGTPLTHITYKEAHRLQNTYLKELKYRVCTGVEKIFMIVKSIV